MPCVPTPVNSQSTLALHAVLCVDEDAFDRFGRVLRHLSVGLIDQAVQLRLLSADPRLHSLSLGPIQVFQHRPIARPAITRRIGEALEFLAPQPPTSIHAIGTGSHRLATAAAEHFDADLFLDVSSLADCDAVATLDLDRVAAFFAASEPLASVLEETLSVAQDRIKLIQPGVLAAQQIACYATDGRAITILCTSPFSRDSGVDQLIEAANMLRQEGHEFLLFLLGRGKQESALRRAVRERNMASFVTFAQPVGDTVHAMQSADVFVRPSMDTGFTVDGLQALGVGMAVATIASPVCSHFRHEETALICEKASAHALADALERLLTDHAYAQRLAENGLNYVRAHHTMSVMAERTASAYREHALNRATFSIRGS